MSRGRKDMKPIVSCLRSLGIRAEIRRTGGGHTRIRWVKGGETFTVITSITPSDKRDVANTIAQIRRYARFGK